MAVHGTIDGYEFQTVLEPDVNFGHWMGVGRRLQEAARAGPGDAVTVEVEPTEKWQARTGLKLGHRTRSEAHLPRPDTGTTPLEREFVQASKQG